MPGIVPNEGEIAVLKRILTGDLIVRLFANDIVPSDGTLLPDFTQATFPGYAGLDMAAGSSPPATDVNDKGSTTSSNLTWTRGAGGGAGLLYGYYVTWSPAGGPQVLLGAERFANLQDLDTVGQTLTLTVTITASKEV